MTLYASTSLEILKHLGDLSAGVSRAMALLPKDGNVEIWIALHRAQTSAALVHLNFTRAVVRDIEVEPVVLAVAAE